MLTEFRVLGDIEVRVNGEVVDSGHARQQCVLAVLLAEVNRVVSTDELIDRVWGEQGLPGNPGGALQTYISLLRRALAAGGGVGIARQAGGYKLTADPAAIDMHYLGTLVSQARDGDDTRVTALLGEALGLWRGAPFGRLDTPWIDSVRADLAAQRHAAHLDLTDARLRLGHHAVVAVELAGQVAVYPLDERLAAQYMTALYRNGRQADALSHYRRVRQHLADELGVEPGSALQLVYQQILKSDPALGARHPLPGRRYSPAMPTAAAEVPRQLPVDVPGFTGRRKYLAKLDLLLPSPTGGPGDQQGLVRTRQRG